VIYIPKRGSQTKEVRTELYSEKMVSWRTGKGHLPEYLAEKGIEVAGKMLERYNRNFGEFHNRWVTIVVPILLKHGVPPLEHAKYKAFVNRLISKVFIKGSQSLDAVKSDFINIHKAMPEVVDEIVSELQKVYA
jgi:hypothetical protein